MRRISEEKSTTPNREYPKILIRENGDYSVISTPNQLPEVVDGYFIQPSTRPRDSFFLESKSTKGTRLVFDSVNPYSTSTGSKNDYMESVDLRLNYDWDNLKTYVVTTPTSTYYFWTGVVTWKDVLILIGSTPMAFDRDTGEELWGQYDWLGTEEIGYAPGDISAAHVTEDGLVYCHDLWPFVANNDYFFVINAKTGEMKKYNTGINFNASVLKPNGDLILTDQTETNPPYNFNPRTGEVTPLPNATVEAIFTYNVGFTEKLFFTHSSDKKLLIVHNHWNSGGPVAIDVETNEVVWKREEYVAGITDFMPLPDLKLLSDGKGKLFFMGTEYEGEWYEERFIMMWLDEKTGEVINQRVFNLFAYDEDTDDWWEIPENEFLFEVNWFPNYVITPDGEKLLFANDWPECWIIDKNFNIERFTDFDVASGVLYHSVATKDNKFITIARNDSEGVDSIIVFDIDSKEIKYINQLKDLYNMRSAVEDSAMMCPNEDGILHFTEAGQVVLYSDLDLPYKVAGKVNPSENKGEELPEGWYTDTGVGQLWTPPTYLYSGVSSGLVLNDNTYLLLYSGTTLQVKEFDGEEYQDFAEYTVGARRALDENGWWYTTDERLNILTGVTETITTSPAIISGTPGVKIGDVIYFETRFAPPSANSQNYRYNESTNTWSTMTSRVGASYSSFFYNGFLYNVGVTTGNPRQVNIYRYTPGTNSWSFVSTSPVPAMGNPSTLSDKRKLIGDDIYMPLEGYKYNIPGDEWVPVAVETHLAETVAGGQGISSFMHKNIIYYYFRHGTWSRVPYNTIAYALPGAVVPH